MEKAKENNLNNKKKETYELGIGYLQAGGGGARGGEEFEEGGWMKKQEVEYGLY